MHDLNLNAPVELTQQVLPAMCTRGVGWVLNISSRTAIQKAPPYPDSKKSKFIVGSYGATKAALNRYTEALAHELVNDGIYINAMAPSNIVMTPGANYFNLETAVGSRKYVQALNAPGKFEKALITNKAHRYT